MIQSGFREEALAISPKYQIETITNANKALKIIITCPEKYEAPPLLKSNQDFYQVSRVLFNYF